MGLIRSSAARLLSLFRKQQLSAELDEEFIFHIERETEANIEKGISPEVARRQALIDFGSRENAGESCSEYHSHHLIETLLSDLRYAVRGLLRSPLFTLTVIVTLALGIGGNTALFSVVNALLVKSLPYQDGNRLIYVSEFWPHEPGVPGPPSPDYAAWRARGRTFERLEAYCTSASLNVVGAGEPARFDTTQVSPGFLNLLGVRLTLGRHFSKEEGEPGGLPTVLLSHKIWRNRFDSSSDVLGKQIEIDGNMRTIIGVLPRSFLFPDNGFGSELLLPLILDPNPNWSDRTFRLLRVLALPKPGISPEEMRKEFEDIVESTKSQEPAQFATMRKDMEVRVLPLRQRLSGDIRPLLFILQSAVAMVLLIGCLNVANLQIGRAFSRQKEIAIRTSLGATRARIARQLLTESSLLGLLGGVAGLGIGAWSLPYVRSFLPPKLHLADAAHIDWTVLTFTMFAGVATGIVTGLASMVVVYRANLSDTMKGGGRSARVNVRHGLRKALVIAEVAIAVVLLAGSGLLIRSFLRLRAINPGFDPRNVLTLRVELPDKKYPTAEKQIAFFSQLVERAQALPQITGVAVASGLPLIGSNSGVGVVIAGRPAPPPGGAPVVPLTSVSVAYFEALSIPLLYGRPFTGQDHEGSPLVVLVNQAFAQQFFAGRDAVGERLKFGSVSRGPWYEIVGVVGNVQQDHLRSADLPNIYVPFRQYPDGSMLLILKATGLQPVSAIDGVKSIHEVDPGLPVDEIATMEMRMADTISADRANMILMGIFGAVALALAIVGIFGVIAYFVSHRSHEIGIRMAVGARPCDVLWLVLRPGAVMTITGIAIGMALAFGCTRVLRTSLYGVSTNDAFTLVTVAATFLFVALVACYIPARRAARIDPITVLRVD